MRVLRVDRGVVGRHDDGRAAGRTGGAGPRTGCSRSTRACPSQPGTGRSPRSLGSCADRDPAGQDCSRCGRRCPRRRSSATAPRTTRRAARNSSKSPAGFDAEERLERPVGRVGRRPAQAQTPPASFSGRSTSLTIGPWPVERTSTATSAPPATLIVSCRTSNGTDSPLNEVVRRVGRVGLDRRTGPATSGSTFVAPHAIRALWPRTTAGTPGNDDADDVERAARRRRPAVQPVHDTRPTASPNPRCGSLASSACFVALFDGPTTQSFEPMPWSGPRPPAVEAGDRVTEPAIAATGRASRRPRRAPAAGAGRRGGGRAAGRRPRRPDARAGRAGGAGSAGAGRARRRDRPARRADRSGNSWSVERRVAELGVGQHPEDLAVEVAAEDAAPGPSANVVDVERRPGLRACSRPDRRRCRPSARPRRTAGRELPRWAAIQALTPVRIGVEGRLAPRATAASRSRWPRLAPAERPDERSWSTRGSRRTAPTAGPPRCGARPPSATSAPGRGLALGHEQVVRVVGGDRAIPLRRGRSTRRPWRPAIGRVPVVWGSTAP